MMNVFLTGGKGLFGTAIVKVFLDHDAKLTVLSRSKQQHSIKNIHTIQGDLRQLHSISSPDSQFDVLIHSAAEMPRNNSNDNPRDVLETNIIGTYNILESIGSRAKKIIYISSIDVYGGSSSKNDPLSEKLPTRPHSYYGISKLAGEHIAEIFCKTHSIPLTILRCTVLYGPGDTINRAIPNFIRNALAGKPIEVTGGQFLRDYLSTGEAARAVYLAANSSRQGTYIVGSGRSIAIGTLAQTICDHIHPAVPIHTTPKKEGFHVILNCAKATRDLKFTARPFPYHLQETIQWYITHIRNI